MGAGASPAVKPCCLNVESKVAVEYPRARFRAQDVALV